jgi:hypothetical protein
MTPSAKENVLLSETAVSTGGGKTPMIDAVLTEQGIRPLGRNSVGGANPIA